MSFLEDIFAQIEAAGDTTILHELRDGEEMAFTGRQLLDSVGKARTFLASKGLNKGERCVLLAHNSVDWVATDLAIMAEGLTPERPERLIDQA